MMGIQTQWRHSHSLSQLAQSLAKAVRSYRLSVTLVIWYNW